MNYQDTIKIPLTLGRFAVVDSCNAHFLQWKWSVIKCRNVFYAVKTVNLGDKRRITYMHHLVTGFPLRGVVDHINGDGLLNTKSNLRFLSIRENALNRPSSKKKKTSKFPGVHFSKLKNKFIANIRIGSVRRSLGSYVNEEEAGEAYQKAFTKLDQWHKENKEGE